ncbi:hypothetical protein ACQP00_24085 [Dactylosporangium sp. CS-047395]|uniref:hypothetical protein n=1 Tax=Dactylosporangium sp. CS-047395 TaxID=3239936 RepID=UPI003D903C2D
MPRTVVPPARFRDDGAPPVGGDSFPERLVKYVPGETLAFFVPLAAFVGDGREMLLVVVVLAGLIGTVGYLWLAGQRAEEDERPLPHFYVLAAVAYLCWAAGTASNVADLAGLDAIAAAVVLGIAVFIVPLLDEVGNRLLRRAT